MRKLANILVTGGSGFIGSNFIRYLFDRDDFTGRVINADCLTYAGNSENLSDTESRFGQAGAKRYIFEHCDISDRQKVESLFTAYNIDTVVHFAAETHVDRSILGPEAFVQTNVLGTFNLLEAARSHWKTADGSMGDGVLFHHVSTDEVYGSLGETGFFSETTPYDPRSPYSASKAASDHLCLSYFHTFGLPLTLSNCSNNYGPYQFPEKLIPLMILHIKEGKPLPVYGDGKNIRDWLHVRDHNSAVWTIIHKAPSGSKYNIGGENEWENIRLLHTLIDITAKELGKSADDVKKTITYVKDRPGHDRRYAIDCSKIKKDLGWKQQFSFEQGLTDTVRWYLSHESWVENVQSGGYKTWIQRQYGKGPRK